MTLPDRVRVVYKDKKNSSGRVRGGEIVLYISSRLPPQVAQQHIEILTRKLMQQVTRGPAPPPDLAPCDVRDDAALARWAAELNSRYYGFPMNSVRFKQQRSRWGSCSWRTRNIYISERLRGGPRDLLEYVLIHEICHLKGIYPPHAPAFWRLVERALPDWRQRRRKLHEYGRWLESRGR